MLYGFKKKKNKEKKISNYEDNNEFVEEIVNNLLETNKIDEEIKYTPKINFNYHDDEKYISKKRIQPRLKIYDEDDLVANKLDKIEFINDLPIKTDNHYKYIHDDTYTIRDMDMDNYDQGSKVGEGIILESTNKIIDEYDDEDNNELLQKKIQNIKKIKEQKRIMEPKEENYDQDFIELKNVKTDDLIKGNLIY